MSHAPNGGESGRFPPVSPRKGASARTARTASRGCHHRNRARSLPCSFAGRERFHQTLQVGGFLSRRDQRHLIMRDDHQVVDAVHYHSTGVGLHYVVAAVEHMHGPAGYVPELVLVAYAAKSVPGADVVPAKVPWENGHVLAALQHSDIDRDRLRDAAKKLLRFDICVQTEGRLELRGVFSYLGQKVSNPPDKNPRIPEISVGAHFFRTFAIRLLDESQHWRAVRVFWASRLNVSASLIRARGYAADRHKGFCLSRQFLAFEKDLAKSCIVADRPISMYANHRRVFAVTTLDGERSPGQCCRRPNRFCLGDNVFARNRRKESAN